MLTPRHARPPAHLYSASNDGLRSALTGSGCRSSSSVGAGNFSGRMRCLAVGGGGWGRGGSHRILAEEAGCVHRQEGEARLEPAIGGLWPACPSSGSPSRDAPEPPTPPCLLHGPHLKDTGSEASHCSQRSLTTRMKYWGGTGSVTGTVNVSVCSSSQNLGGRAGGGGGMCGQGGSAGEGWGSQESVNSSAGEGGEVRVCGFM